jgi:hypothetical protein
MTVVRRIEVENPETKVRAVITGTLRVANRAMFAPIARR